MYKIFNINERNKETGISILLIVSAFIHLSILFVLSLPDLSGFSNVNKLFPQSENDSNTNTGRPRFIAANINQDDQKKINEQTLLSDKDSQEKGYITQERGHTWYSGTTDISLGNDGVDGSDSTSASSRSLGNKILVWNESPLIMQFVELVDRARPSARARRSGSALRIPDTSEISRQNSLYYSNSGQFSLNTVEFKHYEFAKRIVDKIRSNWYPPIMANVAIGGYGGGAIRIRAIPPQDVKTYFKLNRQGDILEFGIIDSAGNRSLNDSCLDSIRLSKNFGQVPDDIKGDVILIPFIFIYR